jgi:hypothetical protein
MVEMWQYEQAPYEGGGEVVGPNFKRDLIFFCFGFLPPCYVSSIYMFHYLDNIPSAPSSGVAHMYWKSYMGFWFSLVGG